MGRVRMHARRGGRWLPVLAVAALLGCGQQPQLNRANRRLIISLQTAVKAENRQWLEQNAELVAAKRKSGELSEAEAAPLEAIVQQGRRGEWKAAKSAAENLARAQQPSADDLERVERKGAE